MTTSPSGSPPIDSPLSPSPRVVRAVIVTSTAKRALQITSQGVILSRGLRVRFHASTSWTSRESDTKELSAGVDIVVATRGRLRDHLSKSNLNPLFEGVRVMVLDEVDKMLESGVHPSAILRRLPLSRRRPLWRRRRQIIMFSGTATPEVISLASSVLHPGYKLIMAEEPSEVPP
ncbi:P-loop containing nucleoside triphosphate hydrolase protein [Gonapodya prolifera JEL478]|uniref:p-loop containing nucleoside triphosphate hydrolase protein n=1 Tax=Gonapodya prolifera (strain JEL478) TaxID=1344416 RepID=A0A139AEI6_GONPJ|nr:P-loop containing nucleoside triphosphate hydrolase protein [Gonapodya prolifera JEL478]|eukprot:KXS15236.1 P-loop containing nucleoside triphosphate hydrolase protein [Gonapodya prolifera JEL478]